MKDTIWIHYARPRTRWYELSDGEREVHRVEWAALDEKSIAGGAILQGTFDIRGQSDFSTIEVWSFSNAEEAFDYWAARVSLGYAEWFAFSNQLGSAKPGLS